MKQYDIRVAYPERGGRKRAKYQMHTPPMASRDHAIWWAACCAAYDSKPEARHIAAMPVIIDVDEIAEG